MFLSASRLGLATVAAAFVAVGIAHAQWTWRGDWRWVRTPPRFATPESFDGSFNFCRLMYERVRREAGGQGWWTDYPSADVNLMIRLSELTKAAVSLTGGGEPNHLVVRATDEALFRCPFVLMSDAGTAGFSDEDVGRLRAYLLKGGFLWADDFWGERAWEAWMREIGRVLPPGEFPVIDVPLDHLLFRTLFEVKTLPQIPSIQFWRASGGLSSERGAESAVPRARGIADRHGRLMVLMTHNTDISDAWEREGEDPEFFYRFSVDGYAVGLNVLMYAMTH